MLARSDYSAASACADRMSMVAAVRSDHLCSTYGTGLQRAPLCCSMLYRVAACCTVLQHVVLCAAANSLVGSELCDLNRRRQDHASVRDAGRTVHCMVTIAGTPSTSALAQGSPLHICTRAGLTPCLIRTRTGQAG